MFLGLWGNWGKIMFVWLSDWISPVYHGVICLHCFKLFHLDVSSFTQRRYKHRCSPTPTPTPPPPLQTSLSWLCLIYEMPLIWPKCLLWDLHPLSSLYLLHPPLSSVTLQSKSEECIAQQAIHRPDNLTNMLLSVFLLWSLSLSLFLCTTLRSLLSYLTYGKEMKSISLASSYPHLSLPFYLNTSFPIYLSVHTPPPKKNTL